MQKKPYSLIYQTVFFPNQQVMKKEDLLVQLKPYFHKEEIAPKTPVIEEPQNKTIIIKEIEPPKPIKNTLFWCIFHSVNGPPKFAEKYDIIMELQERHKITDYFRDKTWVLKNRFHRLTNADVDEVMSNLLTISAKKTFWTTCFGEILSDISQTVVFSQYYKKNIDICIVERRIAVSFIYEEDAEKITLQYEPEKNIFTVVENTITTGYLFMQTMKNCLKPVSQYKIAELVEIGEKIHLLSPPKKKNELYEKIIEHCKNITSSSS